MNFVGNSKREKGVGLCAVISKSEGGAFHLACGNCRGLKIIMGKVLSFSDFCLILIECYF